MAWLKGKEILVNLDGYTKFIIEGNDKEHTLDLIGTKESEFKLLTFDMFNSKCFEDARNTLDKISEGITKGSSYIIDVTNI